MSRDRDDERLRRGAARYLTVRYARGAAGAWDVVGPAALMQLGPVKVTRKNRSTVVRHVHGLEPFQRYGLEFVRGYLTPPLQKKRHPSGPTTHRKTHRAPQNAASNHSALAGTETES